MGIIHNTIFRFMKRGKTRRGHFCNIFTLYIDSLLIKLKESGYGCHMNGTFMEALSYADDITIIYLSIRGLNKMLSICAEFANNYCITFNCAKSMSIKFGNKLSDCEKVKLQGNEIPWVD